MRKESLLHFEGRNVLAAAHNDVFLAINNEEVAVFVPSGHVAGVKPPTAQRFGRGFGLLPVAFEDAIRAGDNLPHSLSVTWQVLVVCINDAEFDAWNGVACHRLAKKALLPLPIHPWLHRRDGQDRRGFRQSVSRKASAAYFFFDFAHQSRRRRRATERDSLQAPQVVLLPLWTIHQRGGHRGNEAAIVDAFCFDEPEDFG